MDIFENSTFTENCSLQTSPWILPAIHETGLLALEENPFDLLIPTTPSLNESIATLTTPVEWNNLSDPITLGIDPSFTSSKPDSDTSLTTTADYFTESLFQREGLANQEILQGKRNVISLSNQLTAAMEAQGYWVGAGELTFSEANSDCLNKIANGTNCIGNNPVSINAVPTVPRGPGEIRHYESASGLTNQLKLTQDEALVFIGLTPPEARYFSFTGYLFSEDLPNAPEVIAEAYDPNTSGYSAPELIGRRVIHASIDNPINIANIKTLSSSEKFLKPTVVIMTPSKLTTDTIREQLTSIIGSSHINPLNIIRVSSDTQQLGYDPKASDFRMIVRVALPESEELFQLYRNLEPYRIFRFYRSLPRGTNPPLYMNQERPDRTTGWSEANSLAGVAIDHLVMSLKNRVEEQGGKILEDVTASFSPDNLSEICMTKNLNCRADNPDASYGITDSAFTMPITLPAEGSVNRSVYVFGVNHTQSQLLIPGQELGKTTYMSLTIRNSTYNAGIISIVNDALSETVSSFLEKFPVDSSATDLVESLAPSLYVLKFTRNNKTDESAFSVEVPILDIEKGMLGLGSHDPINFTERAYLTPGSDLGPSADELIPPRFIVIEENNYLSDLATFDLNKKYFQ